MSLLFPEEFSKDEYMKYSDTATPTNSIKADLKNKGKKMVIQYTIVETNELFFLVLIYLLIVTVLFIFIGFICFSTAAFCARRLDNRVGVPHFNPRLRRLLERIRIRNLELRNILNLNYMSYEGMVDRNMVKEIVIGVTKKETGENYDLDFNQKECNVCFNTWTTGAKVAEIQRCKHAFCTHCLKHWIETNP